MPCNDTPTQDSDMGILQGAKFLQAYLECSDEIQESVRELVAIVYDPNTDADDRIMSLHTLADALLPHPHEGLLGLDLEESEEMGSYTQFARK